MTRAANLENGSAYTEIPAVIVNNLGHILIILRLYLFLWHEQGWRFYVKQPFEYQKFPPIQVGTKMFFELCTVFGICIIYILFLPTTNTTKHANRQLTKYRRTNLLRKSLPCLIGEVLTLKMFFSFLGWCRWNFFWAFTTSEKLYYTPCTNNNSFFFQEVSPA